LGTQQNSSTKLLEKQVPGPTCSEANGSGTFDFPGAGASHSLDTCDQAGKNKGAPCAGQDCETGSICPASLCYNTKEVIEHESIGQDTFDSQDSSCHCETPGQVLREKEVNQARGYRAGVGQVPAVAPDGQVVLPWGWGAQRPLPGFSHEEIKKQLANSLSDCGRDMEAEAVTRCGQELRVGQCMFCLSTPAFPLTCDHRLCPDCASRRSEILISEHQDMLRQIHYPKMMTLTFKSVEHLTRDYFRWARACVNKLRHRKVLAGCWAGLGSFEATYTRGVGWHLHWHSVIGAGYIDQALLSREWQEISGAKIVDIRAVQGDDKWAAIKEVVKYPAKASTFLDYPDLVNEFMIATKGLKLTTGFGALYRVGVSRHGTGKMRCPVCGHSEVDFGGGYGFHVSRDRVKKFRGGYLWLSPGEGITRGPPGQGG